MTNVTSAVENENLTMLQLLVAVPGMVSEKEINRAFIMCAKKGLAPAAQILITAGADINFTDSSGMSGLLHAADAGHCDMIDTLVTAGCSINQTTTSGSTALHMAARHGKAVCLKQLIAAGISKNAQDRSKKSALILAAEHRHTSCLKCLTQCGCDLNLQDSEGLTALHYTTKKAVGVDILLKAGADPDVVDDGGNTALMVAATEGFDNIVTSLVEAGCNTDICNDSNKAPVHFLAMKNHWRGIDVIAHAHGDINLVDNNNREPLWYAVNHNRHHAVKTLLRANCHVDPKVVKEDNIPLKAALNKGLYGVAKLLILAGCKLNSLHTWLDDYEENIRRREAERSRLWVDSDSSVEDNMEVEEAYHWFQDWIHSPHTLRQQCRISIRGYIGQGLLRKAEELPLPPQILDYVTLKEVADHPLHGDLM